jgi:PKD repeat protein
VKTRDLRNVLMVVGLGLAVTLVTSLPGSKVGTSAQIPDPCVSAITLLKTDPANDQTGGPVGENQQLDIQSISIGEDYRYINTEKLVFKMKVAHLNPVPANAVWRFSFSFNGVAWYVAMNSGDGAAISFDYGDSRGTGGTLRSLGVPEDGDYFPDGTIVIGVRKNKFDNPAPGQQVTALRATMQKSVNVMVGTVFPTIDTTPTPDASYTVMGKNGVCIPVEEPRPPVPPQDPNVGRYLNYNPPKGKGTNSGEPTIGVNWKTGKVMYIAGLETLRVNFDECSQRGTWQDVSFPTTSAQSLDPILFTDNLPGNRPDRTFVSQLAGKASSMAYTDNDGGVNGKGPGDWIQTQGSGINSGVDHQSLGAGPFAPPLTRDPNGPLYPHAVYYCSQDLADAYCALSADGGQTFGPAVPMYNATQCTGLHGHPKVAPDGTVYVPNKGCNGKQALAVSTNNGASWEIREVTDSAAGRWDPSLGIGKDGTLYFGYGTGKGRARVAVSRDRGLTWTDDQDVAFAKFAVRDIAFPVVVAGDGDRAAFAFLGTDNPGPDAVWHLYVSHTYNRGKNWTTVNATPGDPVQRGTICSNGLGCGGDRNLLDFNDVTMDAKGRVLVAYADGCVGSCVQGPPNSFSELATIARQSGGKGLLAQFDLAEPRAPGLPLITKAEKDATGVHLAWTDQDSGGAPTTAFKIYRQIQSTEPVAPTLIATVAGNDHDYDDREINPSAEYYYLVTAVNSAGESSSCPSSNTYVLAVPPPAAVTACALGSVVIDDTADAAPNVPPAPELDVKQIYVAEPYDSANPTAAKLTFTIKTAPSTTGTAPPSSEWYLIWNRPAGVPDRNNFDRWYVAMKTGPTGTPAFEYGKFGVPLPLDGSIPNPNANTPVKIGTPDAAFYDARAGVISITISNSKAENVQPGSSLFTLTGRTFLTRPDFGIRSANTAADTTVNADYQLVGSLPCKPNGAPTAALTATPQSGQSPLHVTFDASASADADGNVTAYELDFGDGSTVLEQSSPNFVHSYTTPGIYRARLQVKDNRGALSINVAQVFVAVENVSCETNFALASKGATATASSTYPNDNYSAANTIDGSNTGIGWGNGGGWNDGTRAAYPDWLEVTFDGPKAIDEIRVYTLQDNFQNPQIPTPEMTTSVYGLLDFDVQYWNPDGSGQWVTVPNGSVTGNDRVMRTFTFAAVTTTKIRVLVNNARNNFSRIVEVEAFGCS